jgi:hypothetical protein
VYDIAVLAVLLRCLERVEGTMLFHQELGWTALSTHVSTHTTKHFKKVQRTKFEEAKSDPWKFDMGVIRIYGYSEGTQGLHESPDR